MINGVRRKSCSARDTDSAERCTTSGFEALAFQHEVDHLNGLLFLDRIQSLSTDLFRRQTQG